MTSISKIADGIKKREIPKDVFITPVELAKKHISHIENKPDYIWYDPFRNNGSYYNNFPENNTKKWSEILDNKDFFQFNEPINVVCSNPPYSMIDKVLDHSVKLNPEIISYLIGVNNLTARRVEFMEKNNYFITKLVMLKVYKWFGMSYIVIWEKNKKSILDYDRVIYK